ncbi:XRE family transcriptional regulator [Aureimonas sp. AU20]|uniref:helix-turn-helix domain-containing protein n=1 Tax=Aureimonas sp. AU20 TaxID=1349819 RepID=UPI0007220ECE|nr:XRE family transcriptional regulator [Aureimonas sp. AU20]ALN74458.1 hypothetical protein M673_17145 [Aureimonas sp. AU20]
MDILVDDSERRLAQHIRREREARGWSLSELAARSDVSKAAISKIERGEVSPTAGVLVRLAEAFGLTLAGLLVRAEGDEARLQRSGHQSWWTDPETGYRRRQAFARSWHPVEIVDVELPPGGRVVLPASSYSRIRQVVRVTQGRLRLSEGGELFDLGPGDCLGFGAPGEVTFSNESDAACFYLVALTRS